MIDCKVNTIHVGDSVVFIKDCNTNPSLEFGKIVKIYDNDNECSVKSFSGKTYSHIFDYRLVKM